MGNTRVIGVGEHTHGDLISWRWRLALLRELIDAGYDVEVLCEGIDWFTTNTASPPIRLEDIGGNPDLFTFCDGDFYPHMMAGSNTKKEHFDITRTFSRLPKNRCKFYGIDVQQLNFPALHALAGRKVKEALHDSGAEREWNTASSRTRNNGALRNRLNAKMILHFSSLAAEREKTMKNNTRPTKIVYFAHNEHIAVDCVQSRENSAYKTDGNWIREIGPDDKRHYLSLATFSEHTWNTWDMSKPPLMTVDLLPPRTRKSGVINGRSSPAIPLGDDYVSGDFDFVLMSPNGENIRFSEKVHK